jgi:hypothetical protein
MRRYSFIYSQRESSTKSILAIGSDIDCDDLIIRAHTLAALALKNRKALQHAPLLPSTPAEFATCYHLIAVTLRMKGNLTAASSAIKRAVSSNSKEAKYVGDKQALLSQSAERQAREQAERRLVVGRIDVWIE